MGARHGVQDKIKRIADRRHLVRVGGQNDMVRAEAPGFFLLAGRPREQGHVRAERFGELEAEMPKPAEADDRDFVARPDLPVFKRGVGGNARAEERPGGLRVQPVRDVQHEPIRDNDLVRAAAVGRRAVAAVYSVVGRSGILLAVDFQPGAAGAALAAGVDQHADTDGLADLKVGDIGTNRRDAPDDLMARHHRVGRVAPPVPRLVNIGMTDTAVKNVNRNIVGAGIAPRKLPRRDRRCLRLGGVS